MRSKEGWQVCPFDRAERLQFLSTAQSCHTDVSISFQKFWNHFLPLANQEEMDKVRHRFRIEKDRWSTRDHERMVGLALTSEEGYVCSRKDIQNMEIICLKR